MEPVVIVFGPPGPGPQTGKSGKRRGVSVMDVSTIPSVKERGVLATMAAKSPIPRSAAASTAAVFLASGKLICPPTGDICCWREVQTCT